LLAILRGKHVISLALEDSRECDAYQLSDPLILYDRK
jgi:hypothetical protein